MERNFGEKTLCLNNGKLDDNPNANLEKALFGEAWTARKATFKEKAAEKDTDEHGYSLGIEAPGPVGVIMNDCCLTEFEQNVFTYTPFAFFNSSDLKNC